MCAALACVLLAPISACGQVRDSNPTGDLGGGAGHGGGTAGAADIAGASGTATAPTALALDTADCATRVVSECRGVQSQYSSDSAVFDETPELAPCSGFNSWDGCNHLQYTFDADGCVASVESRGPNRDGLSALRDCLSSALRSARWPCLAGGTLRYDESCLIH